MQTTNLSEGQAEELNRRMTVLQRVDVLLSEGKTWQKITPVVRTSKQTIKRWRKAFSEYGANGLIPASRNSGRQSVAEKLENELGAEKFQDVIDTVRGRALDMESNGLAWRFTARRENTPEPVREYFHEHRNSKHSIAKSLLDLTKINPAMADKHRGARRSALQGFYMPRKLDILPGDVFSSDDTTPIWAYWIPWPKSKLYPFGRKVLQGQFLPIMDVASQHVITFALIARESSSYRAADIWGLFGHTFDLVGLPRLGLQLERGSWDARLIQGEELVYEDDEVSHSRRVGGLRLLPTKMTKWHEDRGIQRGQWPNTLQTLTSYLPKSKSIEGLFHRLQKFEGMMWGALGRDQMRRPYERTKRIYEACKRGAMDPSEHFYSGSVMMQRLREMIEFHEEEEMEGQVFKGRPPVLWAKALQDHGGGAAMPEGTKYLYRRDWSSVTIRKGHAYVRRTDPVSGDRVAHIYCNPDRFPELEGQKVLVYFDRENFETPAQIVHPSGEHICEADYVHRVGMFMDGDMDGYELKRRYAGMVNTMYADLVAHIPSRQIPTEIVEFRRANSDKQLVEDGRGNVTTIERFDRPNDHTPDGDSSRTDRPSHASPVRLPAQRAGVSGLEVKREADPHRREDAGATSRRGRHILNRMDLVDA